MVSHKKYIPESCVFRLVYLYVLAANAVIEMLVMNYITHLFNFYSCLCTRQIFTHTLWLHKLCRDSTLITSQVTVSEHDIRH